MIVVDDGGPTPLDPVVAPFRTQVSLTLIRQRNAGPSAARNAGAERASGEYLAFTDDDSCWILAGWKAWPACGRSHPTAWQAASP